jgi:uncharacterized protein (TIRG00374 family)
LAVAKKHRRWLQGLGGVLLGGACLWFSFRGVDVDQVVAWFKQISWPWIGLALAGVVVVNASKALRWRWLYPQGTSSLSWFSHFSILLIAQMINLVVPVRLGEVARLGLMKQERRPVGMTLGTIAVEKSLDLTTTGLLLLLSIPLVTLPEWLRSTAGGGVLLTGGALLALLLLLGTSRHFLLRLLAKLPRPKQDSQARWMERLIRLFKTVLQGIIGLDGRQLLPVLGLTAFTWLLSLGVIQAVLQAFGVEPHGRGAALALMLALSFSNLAPTPPALVGLVGAVTEVTLAPFGVPRAQALVLGTILNIVLVGPPVALGGWAVAIRLLRLLDAPHRGGLRQALGLAPLNPSVGEE